MKVIQPYVLVSGMLSLNYIAIFGIEFGIATKCTPLSQEEVREYAKWLGMELENDRDLFWIAKEGLKAPLPENWKPCKTVDTDEIYYFNFASGESLEFTECTLYLRSH